MKNISMILWVTQLGLSVAVSPVLMILLAVWLRDSCGWGGWVIWAGIVLGIYCAVQGLRSSLKTMQRQAENDKEQQPPVSFNEHQ